MRRRHNLPQGSSWRFFGPDIMAKSELWDSQPAWRRRVTSNSSPKTEPPGCCSQPAPPSPASSPSQPASVAGSAWQPRMTWRGRVVHRSFLRNYLTEQTVLRSCAGHCCRHHRRRNWSDEGQPSKLAYRKPETQVQIGDGFVIDPIPNPYAFARSPGRGVGDDEAGLFELEKAGMNRRRSQLERVG